MKFPTGARVLLLQDVRSASGAVVEPAGTRGVVKRSTGALVIVTFDGGRTIPVKMEKLGTDSSEPQQVRGKHET